MLVGSIKLQVSFAKEPHKGDAILQKRPIILSILLIVATPYISLYTPKCISPLKILPQETITKIHITIKDSDPHT